MNRRQYVTVGPFSIFFTNVNTAMALKGHAHFATVTMRYRNGGDETKGFPAFEGTYAAIQRRLKELTERPFRDATNEAVAAQLYDAMQDFTDPEIERWGCTFHLVRLELAVRGVPDKIGHADGFTTYTVEEDAP